MRLSHEKALSLYFMYPDLPFVTELHWLVQRAPYIMQSTSPILAGTASARSNTPILAGTGAAASCMCTPELGNSGGSSSSSGPPAAEMVPVTSHCSPRVVAGGCFLRVEFG